MTVFSYASLDQNELLRLAILDGARGRDGQAIVYLKEAVGRQDARPEAHFLLGSLYAQLQMFENANAALQAALDMAPDMAIARIQLGLLYMRQNDAAHALTTLTPLEQLAEDDALRVLGEGLLDLCYDRFSASRARLVRGMALNRENGPLNDDMQHIVDTIDAHLARLDEQAGDRDGAASYAMLTAIYTDTRH